MSKIGRNIKKIRGIKNLSQTEFAALFELKRASIGAYEEGRSEPKISTLIDIANYFGIGIDDLLQKDLSVNNLYRFDIFRKELSKDAAHNLKPTQNPQEVLHIPYLDAASQKEYLSDAEITKKLPAIALPLTKGVKYLAFEIEKDEMATAAGGLKKGDVAVCSLSANQKPDGLEVGKAYIIEMLGEIVFRRVSQRNLSNIVLSGDNPESYSMQVKSKDIRKIWELTKTITNTIGIGQNQAERIARMESEIAGIKNELRKKNG